MTTKQAVERMERRSLALPVAVLISGVIAGLSGLTMTLELR